MTGWPDLRLAGFAAGTWLAAVWALYLSAVRGAELALIAILLALIVTLARRRRAFRKSRSRQRAARDSARRSVSRQQASRKPGSRGFGSRELAARQLASVESAPRWTGANHDRYAQSDPRGSASRAQQRRRIVIRSARARIAPRTRIVTAAVDRLAAKSPELDLGAARWTIIAMLIGAACGAAATAGHVVIRERQPIAGLAAHKAKVTVTGVVASDPHQVGAQHIGPPTYALDLKITSIRSDTVRADLDAPVFVLASGDGWSGLLPGQQIVARGRFEPSEPGELTAATMSVSTPPTLVGRPPWTQRAAGSLRAGLQRACAGLPGMVRGLLPGLIDGDTSRLDPTVTTAFRTTGMTHLLAVSGSNVVMILGAVLLAARWCRAGPTITAVLCTVALIGFVILVRPSPSVLRAAAMGGISLLALATGRTRSALPSLAAVIVALIVYDPALATDIGFSLSVFATAGLLLIAPHWRNALTRRGVRPAVAEALAVPAAAQIACSPLIAGFSGTVSLIAIPANILAIPAVPAATIVGVAAAVISPIWPTGAAFCAWLASWPARWLLLIAEHGAAAPDAVAAWPSGTRGALLMAGLLGGVLFAFRYPAARVIATVSLLAALVGAVPIRWAAGGWPPADAVLVMCDVGQGDGMVLPVGPGRGIVVDSGPEPTAIDGCLRRLGITDVPILFLTHFHADHVGGISGVLDGRRVDAIVTSSFDQPPEGYRDVVTAAAARHIPMSTPTPGQVFTVGAARLTMLGPVARLTGTRSDPNDNSRYLLEGTF